MQLPANKEIRIPDHFFFFKIKRDIKIPVVSTPKIILNKIQNAVKFTSSLKSSIGTVATIFSITIPIIIRIPPLNSIGVIFSFAQVF